ncbi:hypothetical protein DYB31_005241 [Aphanomyces astaci]|uniref:SAP domain-containing protein n=1 Tax=Aphanomyces astaci TaxID=112090 RepID=A0A397EWP6_APHAT|nr:hypothetical protein DYB31_005241 [Aphanomyces astaci]
MDHDDDHFKKAQEHITENSRQALAALEQSAKENSKWLVALCCSISLDIRRPEVNAKKRRLDLDIPQRPRHVTPAVEKRQKSIEEKVVLDEVKAPPPEHDTRSKHRASSRNPPRKRSLQEREDDHIDDEKEEVNPFALKVAELKQELKDRGLKTTGVKSTLVARLLEAIEIEKSEASAARQKAHGYPSDHVPVDFSDDKMHDEIVGDSDVSTVDVHSPDVANTKGSVHSTRKNLRSSDVIKQDAAVASSATTKVDSKPSSDKNAHNDEKDPRKSRMARFVNLNSHVDDNSDDDSSERIVVKPESPTEPSSRMENIIDLVSPPPPKKPPSKASSKPKASSSPISRPTQPPSGESNGKHRDEGASSPHHHLRPHSALSHPPCPLFGGDLSPIIPNSPVKPADESFTTSSLNSPPRAFSMPSRHPKNDGDDDDNESMTMPKSSDLLMSTAASLFATATSPIVKGFASFKSAFGLSKAAAAVSGDDDDTFNSTDMYGRSTTPVPKVPAPKVFQTKATFQHSKRQGGTSSSSLYDPHQARKKNAVTAVDVSVEKTLTLPKSPPRVSPKVRLETPITLAIATTEDAKEREFQETIERESKRLRLAAKESAKKRIEQEMDTIKATAKLSAAAVPVGIAASSSSTADTSTSVIVHVSNQLEDRTMSLPSADSSSSESSSSGAASSSGVTKKPSNLVSGLHSLTSLVEKESTAAKSTTRGAGPIVVTSLRMAERNRLMEKQREAEKKQRQQELWKKYEDQRKADGDKRRKAASTKDQTSTDKMAKDARLKREREAREKKEREDELAKKKQHRLQDMDAKDEKKKKLQGKDPTGKELGMRHLREMDGLNRDTPLPPPPAVPAPTHRTDPLPPPVAAVPHQPPGTVGGLQPNTKQGTPSKKEHTNYEMSDGPESGNSDAEQKKIPKWAQREALELALARQFGPDGTDPTPSVFPDFVDSCDLEGT